MSQFPELPLFKRKLIAIVFVNRDALTKVGLGVSGDLVDEGVVQEEAFGGVVRDRDLLLYLSLDNSQRSPRVKQTPHSGDRRRVQIGRHIDIDVLSILIRSRRPHIDQQIGLLGKPLVADHLLVLHIGLEEPLELLSVVVEHLTLDLFDHRDHLLGAVLAGLQNVVLHVGEDVLADLRSVVVDVDRVGGGLEDPVVVQVFVDSRGFQHPVFCY